MAIWRTTLQLVAPTALATRNSYEWDTFDVLTPEGLRVEVKSAGYLQAWAQPRPSRISFGSLKGRLLTQQNGYSSSATFNADVYVFAIQTAMTQEAYDPLDVGEWEFHVLPRTALEASGYASMLGGGLAKATFPAGAIRTVRGGC